MVHDATGSHQSSASGTGGETRMVTATQSHRRCEEDRLYTDSAASRWSAPTGSRRERVRHASTGSTATARTDAGGPSLICAGDTCGHDPDPSIDGVFGPLKSRCERGTG